MTTKEILEQELEKLIKLIDCVYVHGQRQSIQTINLPEDEHTIQETIDYAHSAILRIVEAALKEFVNKHDSACSHAGPCLEYLLSSLRQERGDE